MAPAVFRVVTVTEDYDVAGNDSLVIVDVEELEANVNVYLPTAVGIEGKEYIVVRKGEPAAEMQVIVNPEEDETIGPDDDVRLLVDTDAIQMRSDGVNWEYLVFPRAKLLEYLQAIFDARYVDVEGDEMTGPLVVDVSESTPAVDVVQAGTGDAVRATSTTGNAVDGTATGASAVKGTSTSATAGHAGVEGVGAVAGVRGEGTGTGWGGLFVSAVRRALRATTLRVGTLDTVLTADGDAAIENNATVGGTVVVTGASSFLGGASIAKPTGDALTVLKNTGSAGNGATIAADNGDGISVVNSGGTDKAAIRAAADANSGILATSGTGWAVEGTTSTGAKGARFDGVRVGTGSGDPGAGNIVAEGSVSSASVLSASGTFGSVSVDDLTIGDSVLSNLMVTRHFDIDYTMLTEVTNGLSQSIEVGLELPAGSVLLGHGFKHSAAFTGGGATDVSCEATFDGEAVSTAPLDIFQAPAAGAQQYEFGGATAMHQTDVAAELIVAFNIDGAHNLAALTTGSVRVWFTYLVLQQA